jgi:hypothetical protein
MNVKITVKDNRNDIILITSSETYAEDLSRNKDNLNVWWCCKVEYDDGRTPTYHVYKYNPDHLSPPRVIKVNGR